MGTLEEIIKMVKIEQDGINKALSGETTLDEVHRTVFFDAL